MATKTTLKTKLISLKNILEFTRNCVIIKEIGDVLNVITGHLIILNVVPVSSFSHVKDLMNFLSPTFTEIENNNI